MRLWRTGKRLLIDFLKLSIHRSIAGSADKTVHLWRTGKRRFMTYRFITLSLEVRTRLCVSGGQVDVDSSILKISIHCSIAGSADKTVRLWRTGKRLLIDFLKY
jgi:hypothetical protein